MLLVGPRLLDDREWLMSQPSRSAAVRESEQAVTCGMTRAGVTWYHVSRSNQTRCQPAV